jgi:hypothetical protein
LSEDASLCPRITNAFESRVHSPFERHNARQTVSMPLPFQGRFSPIEDGGMPSL